eukprot:CAMPEP_0202896480 /NCGR_PEP_ID=MMETSP1392-20130828/5473_1 /ASSEMBLY_ACC=CAM_ASM_000868 /TAXON_ID=225041 /ORGANISM="Chlamydomonas chlamydogama, Strain SAG 11-48b" /LENGTH=699 /DNA_ID=CAMNT_0049581853 /DNA_START=23 /DNA_END=2120 /DNA_ORIENTATION=+
MALRQWALYEALSSALGRCVRSARVIVPASAQLTTSSSRTSDESSLQADDQAGPGPGSYAGLLRDSLLQKLLPQHSHNTATAASLEHLLLSTSILPHSSCTTSTLPHGIPTGHTMQHGRQYHAVRKVKAREEPAAAAAVAASAALAESVAGSTDAAAGSTAVLSAEEYRQAHDISVVDSEGGQVPDPMQRFEDVGMPPVLLRGMKAAGFSSPTSIQAQAWPIVLSGRDLVAIASTGSGKTAGFLLPALMHVRNKMQQGAKVPGGTRGGRHTDIARAGPIALVLAPTRELAKQIEEQAIKFGQSLGIRTACLYGGAGRVGQMQQLLRCPHLIIACPGRLLDFVEGGELSLAQVSYMVLDEADRMLDMGFEEALQQVSRHVPSSRQTLFFSATWPREVQRAAEQFATNSPTRLFIGQVSRRLVAAPTITQRFAVLPDNTAKLPALMDFLKAQPQGARVLVFVGTKMRAEWLLHQLSPASGLDGPRLRVDCLHGDKRQQAREAAIHNFKSGRVPVLVATNVAARGLDVPNVAAVVNFDAPEDPEDYVHRIGRTGRAGAKGESFTMLTKRDANLAPKLIKILEEAGQPVPPEVEDLAAQRGAAPAARTAPPSGAAAGAAAGAAEGGTGTTASSAAMETGPPGARAAGQMGTMRGVMAGSSAAGAGAATQSTTRASWGGRTWREIHTVHTVHTGVGGTAAVTRW